MGTWDSVLLESSVRQCRTPQSYTTQESGSWDIYLPSLSSHWLGLPPGGGKLPGTSRLPCLHTQWSPAARTGSQAERCPLRMRLAGPEMISATGCRWSIDSVCCSSRATQQKISGMLNDCLEQNHPINLDRAHWTETDERNKLISSLRHWISIGPLGYSSLALT